MSKSSEPALLAIPNELHAKITMVAERRKTSKSEVMKLAMEISLEDIKRINYDVAGAVVDKAKGSVGNISHGAFFSVGMGIIPTANQR